jgi:hypothetical protein
MMDRNCGRRPKFYSRTAFFVALVRKRCLRLLESFKPAAANAWCFESVVAIRSIAAEYNSRRRCRHRNQAFATHHCPRVFDALAGRRRCRHLSAAVVSLCAVAVFDSFISVTVVISRRHGHNHRGRRCFRRRR